MSGQGDSVASPGDPAAGGGGRRAWVMMPGVIDYPGLSQNRAWGGVRVYYGARLPAALAAYRSAPHTFERLAEDQLNGLPLIPDAPEHKRDLPMLYPYQVPRVRGIEATHRSGAPGYLLVAPTGAGKTRIIVEGLASRSLDSVLVITKHGIMPAWLRTVDASVIRRWVVINPERLWKLFAVPDMLLADLPSEAAAEAAADAGVPHVPFDAVIVDESQILAHPESLRSRLVHRLMHPPHARPPLGIYASATPFSSLAQTSYVADLIAHAADVEPPAVRTGGEYLDWLAALKGMDSDGSVFALDTVDTIKEFLYLSGVGSAATTQELGLPATERHLHPVQLDKANRTRYDKAWAAFLQSHDLDYLAADTSAAPFADPADSEPLRRVMQASLLKAPAVAEHVVNLVAAGHQVVVPAWYRHTVRTLAWHIAQRLKDRGLPDKIVVITGEELSLREPRRQAFQLGRAPVCVTSVVEGINLHAGEDNADGRGTRATDTPRRTVVADVMTGGKRLLQVEGRAHRAGKIAPVDYLFAEGTHEQVWLSRAFQVSAHTQLLADAVDDAEALLRLHAELADDQDGPSATGVGAR
ncbi:helicase [Streptomyces sp. 8L]|uniref:helicase n=1 Tax=Streptomyces sp. 8L TaxID=2877242 RepID=UPI001CD6AC88|nr:helicase [Streptomyces sp. 8L]MCA1222556.1 helicase [Streptomyces sp. 8L]